MGEPLAQYKKKRNSKLSLSSYALLEAADSATNK